MIALPFEHQDHANIDEVENRKRNFIFRLILTCLTKNLPISFKSSFEKQKNLDTKNEQGQSRNVKQGTQVANEKIILNPDVGQAQTSIPTKWFLEIMNNNFQKYKVANIAEKKDIANDILAKVKERGYSFCRYNRDIDKLVAVENSGRRYIGHIRQMFVRMA
jgi:hypothetical protein